MKAYSTILAALIIGTVPSFSADTTPFRALQKTEAKAAYLSDELVVKFHPGVPSRAVERFNRAQGASVIETLPLGIIRLKLYPGSSPEAAAERYRKNPNVLYAHPNYLVYAAMVPDDPLYRHYQWHLDNPYYGGIHSETAWDEGNGGNGVVIAVLDTGIAYENYDENGDGADDYLLAPDLANATFVRGKDFINGDDHPNDDEGHGTHVSGTLSQSTDNGQGTAGVAFNASLMPVKILNSNGSGSSTGLVNGLVYAADHGADVLNMSLGFPRSVRSISSVDAALHYAYTKGVVLVAASGNDGYSNFVSYPARHADVVAVGATDFYENITYYSNEGNEVELTAPGGNYTQNLASYGYGLGGVYQQTLDGSPLNFGYFYYMGTSMATPHVAAVAALVREANPTLTPGEVRSVLQESAEDHGAPGRDISYGYGIVDAYKAVALAKSTLSNNPPVAVIDGASSGTEDVSLSFSAASSSDPDGDSLTYSWDIDGSPDSGVNITHTFAWGGSFDVTLTVNDGRGGSATTTQSVAITEVNDIPASDAGGAYSGTVGTPLLFDASASQDYDNSDGTALNDQTLTYTWSFGDGSAPMQTRATTASHTYAQEGTYSVSLSVSDGIATDQSATTASITAAPSTVLAAPSNLAATVSTGSVILQWTDNAIGESGFEVQRAEKIKGKYDFGAASTVTFIIEVPDTTTFTDAVSGDYRYRVRAYDATNFSPYSNEVNVKVR